MHFHQAPTTFVETVHLKVKNIAQSVAFYQEVIGFSVLEETKKHVSLTADGKTTLLRLEEIDHATPRNNRETGLFHFALLLPSRGDLGRFLHHLIQIGHPMGAGDHHVSEALYLNDLDGNGIEIYTDRHPTDWKWQNGHVFMGTEHVDTHALLALGESLPWNTLPSDTVMGHIHLQVNNLQKAQQFYTETLGFELVCEYGKSAVFLSTGNYHHHIALNVWASNGGNVPSKRSVGLKEFTIVYPTHEKIEKAVAQVIALGYAIEQENHTYITTDPAGNTVRLIKRESSIL